jgi:rod shape-determining protein MreC
MDAKAWEQIRDWVLLAVLLLASLLTMLSFNQPLVRSLRATTLELTARVEHRFAWLGRYARALQENDALRQQNIQLSSEVARSRAARARYQELASLLALRDSSDLVLQPARIIVKDIFRQKNTLTLDVGRADSVAVGMPVVHSDGIVGTVVLVSEHYCRVMPFLNTDFRVPALVQPLQAEGIVRWDGERLDRLVMDHVVKTEPVEPGQPVVTSGHSDVFPSGRRIGTVDSVAVQPGRNELLVYLTPDVTLSEIHHAFVVLRRPDAERVTLDQRPVGTASGP